MAVLTSPPPRRVGRPPKPPAPRPRRKPGTGSISVTKGGRVFALDSRDASGRRESYEAAGADIAARVAEAERWIADRIARRKRLAGLAPEIVRDYLERYFWQKYRSSPASTQAVRRSQMKRAASIGDLLVVDVTESLVNDLTDAMVDAGYSAGYCREVRGLLRSAFAKLVPSVLATNPVGRYPGQLVTVKRRPNVLDQVDAADFERVALRTRWGLLWVVAIRYGLRGGELRALQWPDLNQRTCELTVRHGMRSGRRLADTKNHQERTIRIVPALMRALFRLVGTEHSAPGWVFAMPGGKAIPPNRFAEDFAAIVERVNAERFTAAIERGLTEIQAQQTALPSLKPHGLRHTAATLMLRGSATRRGVSIAKVSAILGHADSAFTQRIYGWAVPSDDDVVDGAVSSMMAELANFEPLSGQMAATWQHTTG